LPREPVLGASSCGLARNRLRSRNPLPVSNRLQFDNFICTDSRTVHGIGLDRRLPVVLVAGFASDMQPSRTSRHLIAGKHLLPSQEPDVTRILPSGAFSTTSVALSVTTKRSRTFSRFFTDIIPPARPRAIDYAPVSDYASFDFDCDRHPICRQSRAIVPLRERGLVRGRQLLQNFFELLWCHNSPRCEFFFQRA
jgi:hypothetical protein